MPLCTYCEICEICEIWGVWWSSPNSRRYKFWFVFYRSISIVCVCICHVCISPIYCIRLLSVTFVCVLVRVCVCIQNTHEYHNKMGNFSCRNFMVSLIIIYFWAEGYKKYLWKFLCNTHTLTPALWKGTILYGGNILQRDKVKFCQHE